jgi:TetR/AcrR family transcriptional repressor of nem operon
MFAAAPYHEHESPLDRVLGYIALRRSFLQGEIASFSCVAGTMVQETYQAHPEIRDACGACIFDHVATLVEDIRGAMRERCAATNFSAESLATHMQAVIQGAFILAKAKDDVSVAVASLDHLRGYVELVLSGPASAGTPLRAKQTRERAGRTKTTARKDKPT